jgi:hypothetical protein
MLGTPEWRFLGLGLVLVLVLVLGLVLVLVLVLASDDPGACAVQPETSTSPRNQHSGAIRIRPSAGDGRQAHW